MVKPGRRGFTLVEIVVALSLSGLVAAASFSQFLRVSNTYREQMERLEINSDLRIGISIVRQELMNLDAADPVGSDIVSMGMSDIVYNAMRVLLFLCQPASIGDVDLVAWRTPVYGYRGLDIATDSLMLHQGLGRWARVDLKSVSGGGACPGGAPSLTLSVAGNVPALESGAPIRAFEGARLHLYSSSGFWLGGNRLRKNGSWIRTQPIVGPLSRNGFQLEFLNVGVPTSDNNAVTSVRVRLVAVGPTTGVSDTISTVVALRNN